MVTKRLTGVNRAVEITDQAELADAFDDIISKPFNWDFPISTDWRKRTLVNAGDYIYVTNSRGKPGDVLVSVGDYVVYLNDGRRVNVFTPDLKVRVAQGDFGWLEA